MFRQPQLYGFEFDGVPVESAKIHIKELSPGVIELRIAWARRLRVQDKANYFELGERFDALNHVHTAWEITPNKP